MDTLTTVILVSMLGSPQFATRQAASEGLARMGDGALPVLLLYEGDGDPEVRRRVGQLIEARKPAMVERLVARHPRLRVDALPLNHPNRWQLVDNYLASADWPDTVEEQGDAEYAAPYRGAVRLLIVDLLYNGTSYADVSRLLDCMAERQAREWNGNYWRDEVDE
jgi:hypothetical protein